MSDWEDITPPKKSASSDWEDVPRETPEKPFLEKAARFGLGALPIAGGIGGGLLGGGAGPIGSFAGGTAGYAGGKALEREALQHLYGDKGASLEDIPGDLKEGAIQEAIGPLVGKLGKGVAMEVATNPMIQKGLSKASGLLDSVARAGSRTAVGGAAGLVGGEMMGHPAMGMMGGMASGLLGHSAHAVGHSPASAIRYVATKFGELPVDVVEKVGGGALKHGMDALTGPKGEILLNAAFRTLRSKQAQNAQ